MKYLKKTLAVVALVSGASVGTLLFTGVTETVKVVQKHLVSPKVAMISPTRVSTKLTAMEIFEQSPMSFGGYRE